MGWNTVERNWKELKGKLKETWGDMTDDELDVIAGKREQLVGKIQTKYEIAREEAERQVNAFAHDCDSC
ncbi:CsbD family protein [Betaproteobacteria bacterium PRO5]|nr:CsbD family protein [Betaproteobacteria bacterium PRO5]